MFRKISTQLLNYRNDLVVPVGHGEHDLIFWIIKTAKTGEVFVSLVVDTTHGLYDAGRRQESPCSSLRTPQSAEVTNHAPKRQ